MTLHAQNIYRDLPDEKNTGKKVTVRVIERSETNLKASQESDYVNAKCQTFLRSFTIRHSVPSTFSPCLPPKILDKFLTMVSSFSWVLQSSQEKSKTTLMLSYYFFAILVAVAVATVLIQKFCHHGNMTSYFSSLFSVYYNFITNSLSPILNYQIVNSISYSYSIFNIQNWMTG